MWSTYNFKNVQKCSPEIKAYAEDILSWRGGLIQKLEGLKVIIYL